MTFYWVVGTRKVKWPKTKWMGIYGTKLISRSKTVKGAVYMSHDKPNKKPILYVFADEKIGNLPCIFVLFTNGLLCHFGCPFKGFV